MQINGYKSPFFGALNGYTDEPNPEYGHSPAGEPIDEYPNNPPETAIDKVGITLNSSQTVTRTVAFPAYSGSGAGSGNATYIKVYGRSGGATVSDHTPIAKVVPKLSSDGQDYYKVRVAQLNVTCAPTCRHPKATSPGTPEMTSPRNWMKANGGDPDTVPESEWIGHRSVVRAALIRNPNLTEIPDVVGIQEAGQADVIPGAGVRKHVDDIAQLMSADYEMGDMVGTQWMAHDTRCRREGPLPVPANRILINKARFTFAKDANGNNITGAFQIGCTDAVAARVAAAKAAPEAGNDNIAAYEKTAVYALVEQKAGTGDGSGKKFWVMTTHMTPNSQLPKNPTLQKKKSIYTVRGAARLQAAEDINWVYNQLNVGVNAPLILTGDFNSDAPFGRNGGKESPQQRLINLGFKDATGYGTTTNLNFTTLPNFDRDYGQVSSDGATGMSGDPDRYDYIMMKGALGANNYYNHINLGHTLTSNSFTVQELQTNGLDKRVSEHALQTADIRLAR